MDENRELLTVGEVAERLNISKRAVYKRIASGKWKDQLVMEDGRKMIRREVLDENRVNPESSHCPEPVFGSLQPLENIERRLDEIENRLSAIEGLLAQISNNIKENQLPPPQEQEREPEQGTWFSRFFRSKR